MRIEFLGTAGAAATPLPGASDPTSVKARTYGAPYSRYGPCIFVHGPDILIDTPEECRLAMDRAGISHLKHCIFSHWHPDHTFGRRILEFNRDWGKYPAKPKCTQVYLLPALKNHADNLGLLNSLKWYERWGWVKIHEIDDDKPLIINHTTITPLAVTPDLAYGFIFTTGDKRVLIVPDEVHGWSPTADVVGVDVAILPAGLMVFNPHNGHRRWDANHPILKFEPTFEDILHLIEQIKPKTAIVTHLEANDMPDFDQLNEVADKLTHTGKYGKFIFAWDTLCVEV
jgi:phosphoribosyl 1,2-cyclic phosphate phosphodiesterase